MALEHLDFISAGNLKKQAKTLYDKSKRHK
jgi:hypothetical protein